MIRCFLLLCCVAMATAAQFNPRVSATAIPLNDSVRATFATTRPQVAGVDVGRAVQTALELPSVVRDWRLVGQPEVVHHEKAGDVTISILLRPRHSGELALPQIPVTWLEGRRSVDLPAVTVHDHIIVGTEQRDLPSELQAVAGYAWGAEQSTILAADAGNEVIEENEKEVLIRTANGLHLRLLDGQLAETRLVAPGLDLEAAQGSFIQRWGSPIAIGDDRQRMEWLLGWLHITAETVRADEGAAETTIRIVHEGISNQAMRKRVKSEVFDLLESGSGIEAAAPAPEAEAEAEAEPTADGADTVEGEGEPEAAAEADGVSMDEIEAELQRRVER